MPLLGLSPKQTKTKEGEEEEEEEEGDGSAHLQEEQGDLDTLAEAVGGVVTPE